MIYEQSSVSEIRDKQVEVNGFNINCTFSLEPLRHLHLENGWEIDKYQFIP